MLQLKARELVYATAKGLRHSRRFIVVARSLRNY
jgi:hypothetical protein